MPVSLRATAVAAPWLWGLVGFLAPLSSAAGEEQVPPPALPALGTVADQASVVGVGSGGYMATQLAVAWPERFHGLGVLAAGPWGCAQGKLSLALTQCMMTRVGEPSLAVLEKRRADYQSRGQLGEDAALSRLRAFVWHGQQDDVIEPVLGDLLAQQLDQWLASSDQLKVERDEQAGHSWPQAADKVAGDMLNWLYPERRAGAGKAPAAGALRTFDQSNFDARGLADTGYVYVPEACTAGGCGATLALHGCRMSAETIGDTFARNSGLNTWADAHGEVVLYPQAESSLANPQGCWDWWGFAESSWQLYPLHDTRDGTQAGALLDMLSRLQASPEAR